MYGQNLSNTKWVLDNSGDLSTKTTDYEVAKDLLDSLDEIGLSGNLVTSFTEDGKSYGVYIDLQDHDTDGDDDLIDLTPLGEQELDDRIDQNPVAEPDGKPNYMGDTGIGRIRSAYEESTPDPGEAIAKAIEDGAAATSQPAASFREIFERAMAAAAQKNRSRSIFVSFGPENLARVTPDTRPNRPEGGGGVFSSFAKLQNESSVGQEPEYKNPLSYFSTREERVAYAKTQGRIPKFGNDSGLCINPECNVCWKDARRLRPGMAQAAEFAGHAEGDTSCNYCYEDNN